MDLFKKALNASLKILQSHKRFISGSLYGLVEDKLIEGADVCISYVNGEMQQLSISKDGKGLPNLSITIVNYTNLK